MSSKKKPANAADQEKLKMLTDEEKKAFADKCSVECEEVKADTPKDVFATTLKEYSTNMQLQIPYLESAIVLHQRILNMLTDELNRKDITLSDSTHKVYAEELSVRKDLIFKCKASIAVMQERLAIAPDTIAWMLENFDKLCEVDFLLNNRLDLPGTKERVQKIADKIEK